MPYPGLLHPEPRPLWQTTADPRHSDTVLAQSRGVSGSWGPQGMFEPSERLWRGRRLILNTMSPLLPSCWGFSFALGCGVSFFGGLQHSPVNGCSAVSCSFGVLTGEVDCMSFYYTILHQTQALITLSRASRETARGPVAPWVPTAAAFCRKMCSHKTS